MNCLTLMWCEFVNERTQVNVEVRVMPLYWLCYRHNNSICVVIEPGASEFVSYSWRPEVAAQRADSLRRAIDCLKCLAGPC
jgi:hypothetical protein